MAVLNIPPLAMIEALFGSSFEGQIVLWERQGKTAQFFSAARLDQLEKEIERLLSEL